MQGIIKVTTNEQGSKVVSARELYEFLCFEPTNWKRWSIKNIEQNPFALENTDWVGFVIMKNGNETKDYALSLDFSKRLAMMARTEKGEEARQYFLDCERKLTKPLSMEEIMIGQLQAMIEAKKDIADVKQKVEMIEARTTTRPDFFTVAGYAKLNKLEASIKVCSAVGVKAARICKERGYQIDKCEDPRFGTVNMYPRSVLSEVFNCKL